MTDFTPISAIIGGSLIGLSAVLLMLLNGRVAGISGMIHGLGTFKPGDFLWRALFLLGLVLGGVSYYLIPQIQFPIRTNYSIYLLILSGFFVGIGTKLSNGCTSGHGVCGIARVSLRSIVATIVFLVAGISTTYVVRHF